MFYLHGGASVAPQPILLTWRVPFPLVILIGFFAPQSLRSLFRFDIVANLHSVPIVIVHLRGNVLEGRIIILLGRGHLKSCSVERPIILFFLDRFCQLVHTISHRLIVSNIQRVLLWRLMACMVLIHVIVLRRLRGNWVSRGLFFGQSSFLLTRLRNWSFHQLSRFIKTF